MRFPQPRSKKEKPLGGATAQFQFKCSEQFIYTQSLNVSFLLIGKTKKFTKLNLKIGFLNKNRLSLHP